MLLVLLSMLLLSLLLLLPRQLLCKQGRGCTGGCSADHGRLLMLHNHRGLLLLLLLLHDLLREQLTPLL